MPELGPYGSVRGALSNERSYRDLMVETDAECGDDLRARRQGIDADGIEVIPGSAQDASGAGFRRAAGDLSPIRRPGRVLRVQAGIVILGGARLDRLGQLAGDEQDGFGHEASWNALNPPAARRSEKRHNLFRLASPSRLVGGRASGFKIDRKNLPLVYDVRDQQASSCFRVGTRLVNEQGGESFAGSFRLGPVTENAR
jgi:hypothetical protein